LGLVLAQRSGPAPLSFDRSALALLRGVLADLCAHLGLPEDPWQAVPGGALENAPGWAHPRASLIWQVSGQSAPIAHLAELDPRVTRSLELAADVAAARIDLSALSAQLVSSAARRYRPIPRFPGVKLDVAFAAPESKLAGELIELIRQAGKGLVEDLELFDLYRGAALGPGKKSLAFRLVLQAPDRTLDEADLEKFLERLARAAERSEVELRRG
jgi:phenylalanyl-tRNA synthetase beta subunit